MATVSITVKLNKDTGNMTVEDDGASVADYALAGLECTRRAQNAMNASEQRLAIERMQQRQIAMDLVRERGN